MPDSPDPRQIPDCSEIEAAIDNATTELAQQELDLANAEQERQAAEKAERDAFADWEKAAEARNDNSKLMADMADHAYDENSLIIGRPRYTPAFKALDDKQPGLDAAAKDAWDRVEQCQKAHDAARARVRQLQAEVDATKAWLEQLRAAAERCGIGVGDIGSRVKLKLAALILLTTTVIGGFFLGGRASAHGKRPVAKSTPSTTVTTFEDGLPLPPLPARFRTTTTVASTPSTTTPATEPAPTRREFRNVYVPPPSRPVVVIPRPPPTSTTVPKRTIDEPPPIVVTTTTTTWPRELG
jgi:hypothetical protein